MDVALAIALVAGGFSFVSGIVQIKPALATARNTRAVSEATNANIREKQIDEKIWEMVTRSEKMAKDAEERTKLAEEDTAKIEAKYKELKVMYNELLERTELLENSKVRDQSQIRELTLKIEWLERSRNEPG